MKHIFTVCYMVTGGIDIEAETSDEAIDRFNSGEFAEEILNSLNESEITLTEVYKQDEY